MEKPLKRSTHLIQLSKEHHFSLLFCWKVRQGIKKGIAPDRMVAYVAYFWKEHLLPHFSEEDILFRTMEDPLIQRAYREHSEINALVQTLSSSKDHVLEQLAQVADRVEQHVRFEERELFPYLERALPQSALARVAQQLLEMQPEPLQDLYADTFWSKEQ